MEKMGLKKDGEESAEPLFGLCFQQWWRGRVFRQLVSPLTGLQPLLPMSFRVVSQQPVALLASGRQSRASMRLCWKWCIPRLTANSATSWQSSWSRWLIASWTGIPVSSSPWTDPTSKKDTAIWKLNTHRDDQSSYLLFVSAWCFAQAEGLWICRTVEGVRSWMQCVQGGTVNLTVPRI